MISAALFPLGGEAAMRGIRQRTQGLKRFQRGLIVICYRISVQGRAGFGFVFLVEKKICLKNFI